MVTNWKICTLEEVTNQITDGSHYSPKESQNGTKIIATVKNMTEWGFDFSSCKRISECDYVKLVKNGCKVEKGDIVFSKDGTVGNTFVYESDIDLVLLSSIAIIRPNEEVNPYFLNYYLSLPEVQKSIKKGHITGSVLQRIVLKDLRKIKILIPSYKQQEVITEFLLSLDLKRRIGSEINRSIVKLAELIFRHWFIDFEFPNEEGKPYKSNGGKMITSKNGMLPINWKIEKLGNICSIVMGQSPKSEFYNKIGDGLPFHQGISNFGERFPIHKIFCSALLKIAHEGDILFSVRAPVGRINLTKDKIVIGRGLSAIRQKNNFQSFLYYSLKNKFYKDDIIGSGTVFAAITRKDIEDLEIILPSKDIIQKFEEMVSNIDKFIEHNHTQIEILMKLRDLFLPRLFSGEISIREKNNHK